MVIWSFLFDPISVARLIVARLASENQMRGMEQSFWSGSESSEA
jgi:hypothetical protein